MASIKVLHGSIARRFTVPNDTTWSSFESQIRSLFHISSQTPISLSYTDEDGDVITLSSDLELQEILSDQEFFGSSVKFVLSTPDELAHNEKNSWVLEASTSQIKEEEELSNSIKDNDVISFSSSDEEDGLETSHESREQSSNESQQQQPFVFTEFSEFQKNSNYKHVTVTDEETEEPTFKPTIVSQQPETIDESSSSSIVEEEKSKEMPEKEEKQPESDQSTDNNNDENIFWIYNNNPHCDVLFNDYSPYYDYYSSYCRYSPFRHSRIHRPFGTRRHCPISVAFYKFIKFVLVTSLIITIAKSLFFMICPLLKILFLVFALKYLKSSCHNDDDDEEKFGSCNGFGFRRRFGRCYNRRFNRNNQYCQRRESCNGNISEEGVAEKVKILRDMGFEGENFEELVKLYNGNIDFAVEALLQR